MALNIAINFVDDLIEKIGAAMNIANDVQSYIVRNFKVVLHSHSYTNCPRLRGRLIGRMLNLAPTTHARTLQLERINSRSRSVDQIRPSVQEEHSGRVIGADLIAILTIGH